MQGNARGLCALCIGSSHARRQQFFHGRNCRHAWQPFWEGNHVLPQNLEKPHAIFKNPVSSFAAFLSDQSLWSKEKRASILTFKSIVMC